MHDESHINLHLNYCFVDVIMRNVHIKSVAGQYILMSLSNYLL